MAFPACERSASKVGRIPILPQWSRPWGATIASMRGFPLRPRDGGWPSRSRGPSPSHGRRRPIVPITSRRTCNPSATAALLAALHAPAMALWFAAKGEMSRALDRRKFTVDHATCSAIGSGMQLRRRSRALSRCPNHSRVDMKQSIETHREGPKTIENRSVSGPDQRCPWGRASSAINSRLPLCGSPMRIRR